RIVGGTVIGIVHGTMGAEACYNLEASPAPAMRPQCARNYASRSRRRRSIPVSEQQQSADRAKNTPNPTLQRQSIPGLNSIDDVMGALAARAYIADRGLATALFLAIKRQKPLLLEGEPGVGKTEVARVLADILQTRMIRLQCYEGIDQATAVYEWTYARQLMAIRLLDNARAGHKTREAEVGQV